LLWVQEAKAKAKGCIIVGTGSSMLWGSGETREREEEFGRGVRINGEKGKW
jgi:hypothetical protein